MTEKQATFIAGALFGAVALMAIIAFHVESIDSKLSDVRTIASQARDTLNCMQAPQDPACSY